MKSFRDYLGLTNSCSYDVDDVIGRADRFGFQNFCSPGNKFSFLLYVLGNHWSDAHSVSLMFVFRIYTYNKYLCGVKSMKK